MKKKPSRFFRWLRNGNDCEKCPCAWEERGMDDWDAGCYMGVDWCDSICRWPLIVRWYMARRANYLMDHEYDDLLEWYEIDEKMYDLAKEAVVRGVKPGVLCWTSLDADGKLIYHEYDQDMKLNDIVCSVWLAIREELGKEQPSTLRAEWSCLIKKTWKRICYNIHVILTF